MVVPHSLPDPIPIPVIQVDNTTQYSVEEAISGVGELTPVVGDAGVVHSDRSADARSQTVQVPTVREALYAVEDALEAVEDALQATALSAPSLGETPIRSIRWYAVTVGRNPGVFYGP